MTAIQHGVLRHVVRNPPGPRQDYLIKVITLWEIGRVHSDAR